MVDKNKHYCKCELNGEENGEIIAEYWKAFLPGAFVNPWFVGRDLLTDTLLIFLPNNKNDLASEIKNIGITRKILLGAIMLDDISEEEIIKVLNDMSLEDIYNYKKLIEEGKTKHKEMLREYKGKNKVKRHNKVLKQTIKNVQSVMNRK